MPRKEKTFTDFDAMKKALEKTPNVALKLKDPTAKLNQLVAKAKVPAVFVSVFDDADGVLAAVARVGSTQVALGAADVEAIVPQKQRMDALQYLKGLGCLDEVHLAAVMRRSLRTERRVHELAVKNHHAAKLKVEKLKVELKEALDALETAAKEVKAAEKALATP